MSIFALLFNLKKYEKRFIGVGKTLSTLAISIPVLELKFHSS